MKYSSLHKSAPSNMSGILTLVIMSLLLLSGCVSAPTSSDQITVVTTIFPLYEFAKAIGGDKADVTLLLPPGVEAHSFEPKPSDIVKVHTADIFVYAGAGMEPWAKDIIEGSNKGEGAILDASSKLTLLKAHDDVEHFDEAHASDTHAFEWAGTFELTSGTYYWSFAKVDGEYADPAMKMVIFESDDIKSVEQKVVELLELRDDLKKNDMGMLIPREVVYLLEFDQAKNVSVFGINISTAGSYVFFTEHMPAEFESSEHFFKDDLGRDVEPVKTEPEYDEHHHGEYDPHFWLDFTNDVIVVNAIAETLSQKDPVNSEYYFANAKEYTRKLVALDDAYKQGLASCKTTEFISGGHSVYNYLSQRYGLTTHSIYGLSPDSEPTPQTIKDIIDLTREHNLKYILFEELVNPSIAQSIAQQTNTKTLAFSPGENLGKEEFESGMTFFTLMEGNLNTLRIVLACE